MTVLLEIEKTARPYGRGQNWFRYDSKLLRFDSVPDALAEIVQRYRGKKRAPVYVDTKTRGTIQSGWIYSGRDDGNYTQDWVTLAEVVSETAREARSIDVRGLRLPKAT